MLHGKHGTYLRDWCHCFLMMHLEEPDGKLQHLILHLLGRHRQLAVLLYLLDWKHEARSTTKVNIGSSPWGALAPSHFQSMEVPG